MEKGLQLVVEFVENIDSTQSYLIQAIKLNAIKPPFAIVANSQNSGIGSRNNSWESKSGNLYFSFCVKFDELTDDLPKESASIYFAMIMREFLAQMGSEIWVKWPNDFYLENKKIGGVITNLIGDVLVCGMGVNLVSAPENSTCLDINLTPTKIVYGFFDLLKFKLSWKLIFSKFSVEFEKSRSYTTHSNDGIISLKEAILCDDGSVIINNKKVFSLR